MQPNQKAIILNVNGDIESRALISSALREANFEVEESSQGQEALALALANKPHLILLELNLPDLSGNEICRRIKEDPATSSIPILQITNALTGFQSWPETEMDQIDGYLIPPISVATLITTIRAMLRMSRAEEINRLSARQWQATFDAISEGVALLDLTARVIRCNEAFTHLPGPSPNQIVGQVRTELLPNPLDRSAATAFPLMLETRSRQNLTLPFYQRWYQATLDPVMNETGDITGAVYILSDITDRREAEQELAHHRFMLTQVIDLNPFMVYVKDRAGRYIIANQAAAEVYGVTPDQLIGRTDFDFQTDLDRARTLRHEDELILSTGNAFSIQSDQIVDAQGKVRQLQRIKRPMVSPDGTINQILGVAIDITQHNEVERALRDSEQRYRQMFEQNRAVQLLIDPDSSAIVDANSAAAEFYGYPLSDLKQMKIGDLNVLPAEEIAAEIVQAVTERRRYFLFQHRLASGELRDVEVYSGPVDSKGRRLLYSVVLDITERKRVEAALRQSEERYRRFFEEDLAGAFIATPEGQLLECNPAFATTFGFDSVQAALSYNLNLLYPRSKSREEFFSLLRRERKLSYFEEEGRRLDGRPVHLIENIIGEFDEADNLIRIKGYVFDITKHKELESQLRQAQKMDAVGRLAGGIAHDFNNLLTIIKGYADLTLMQLDKNDPLYRNIDQIDKAGQRAAGLTRQLLAFSRKQVLQPKVIDLNSVVLDMDKMLRRLISEDITLITKLSPVLGRVKADPGQLEQVIMNLAVNARDAMPGGGKLIIETNNVIVGAPSIIGETQLEPGSYVLFSVTDTGHGIDSETLSRIFEPFFTTKEQGKGTGLGLSTVYGIVKQSEGYIFAESLLGHGASFKIYLPRVEAPADALTSNLPSRKLSQGSETILLVEDEEGVRKMALEILNLNGYYVLEAANGGEALLNCEQHKGPIHLMITDTVMPKMNGPELAERLTRLRPEMKVLFISGYTDEAITRRGALESGAAFLQKPFAPDELARCVRDVLEKVL